MYNEGPLGIGCYWDLPPEASGNTDRILAPGKSFRYPLFETESDVRWSGNIWASTGCDEANGGIAGCATGVCFGTDNNVHCPAYVGPGGPTTKAEFTLSDSGTDYYDVSAIDGVNLGMTIAPDDPWFYSAEESERENIKKVRVSPFVCACPNLDILLYLCMDVFSYMKVLRACFKLRSNVFMVHMTYMFTHVKPWYIRTYTTIFSFLGRRSQQE